MRLIDLLLIISDNSNVNILNTDRQILSRYDGRDAIDNALNDNEVLYIESGRNAINIIIRE